MRLLPFPLLLLACDADETRCSPWFPVDDVRTEVWATTADNPIAEGGITQDWLGMLPEEPGTYRVEVVGSYRFAATDTVIDLDVWREYTCDATGVYLARSGGRDVDADGLSYFWEEVAQGSILEVPTDLGEGWVTTYSSLRGSPDGNVIERNWTTTHEVLGTDSITTPAGTFATTRVRSRLEPDGAWSTSHLSEGVGRVLLEQDIELIERIEGE